MFGDDDDDDDFVVKIKPKKNHRNMIIKGGEDSNHNTDEPTKIPTADLNKEDLELAILLQAEEDNVTRNYRALLETCGANDFSLAKALSRSLIETSSTTRRKKKWQITDETCLLAPSIVIPRQTQIWFDNCSSSSSGSGSSSSSIISRTRDFTLILAKSRFEGTVSLYLKSCL